MEAAYAVLSPPAIVPLIPLINALPRGDGVEVGCYWGHSSALLEAGPHQVFYVDSWQDTADLDKWRHRMPRPAWDRAVRKPSVEAARDFPDGVLAFVFLDAGHTFQETLADIRAWRPKVMAGGLLCGHDWDLFLAKDGPGPVGAAVTTYCRGLGAEWEVLPAVRPQLACWAIRV